MGTSHVDRRAGIRWLTSALFLAASLIIVPTAWAETVTQTYSYTGGEQVFTVPSGTTSIRVAAVGGHGGAALRSVGGTPARVTASVPVFPGESLYVEVGGNGLSAEEGGAGGFNGGGSGGMGHEHSGPSGGGGGASDVRTSPRAAGLSPDPRLVVAGGGGGAGGPGCGSPYTTRGGNGGDAGSAGETSPCGNYGGGPGTSTGGGYAGEGGYCGATSGSLGRGGSNVGPCWSVGGGGGAGYYGGGSGAGGQDDPGGGGGGGSSFVPSGGNIELTNAQPEVQISYEAGPDATTEAATAITDQAATLNGTVGPERAGVTACAFEYGTTPEYGLSAPCEPSSIASEGLTAISAHLAALTAKTHYHYRVVLTTSEGTAYGQDEEFETLPEPPVVSAVSPPAGFVGEEQTVTITGSHFDGATRVVFGETPVAFKVNSDTSITATSPQHATGSIESLTGAIDVTVTTPGGTTATSPGDHYVFVEHGHAPTITGLSIKKGPAVGGTQVTISGTGFDGVTAVKFGQTDAAYTVHGLYSITAVSPPEESGEIEVTVYTPNGESGETSKDRFTYGPPTVTGVAPAQEPISGGGQITVTGSGFDGHGPGTWFEFGKTPAENVQCPSSTECVVTVPPATRAGTVDIRAEGVKTSKKTTADHFTYETPTITGLSEPSGPQAGGVEIIVHGAGFAPGPGKTIFAFGTIRAIRVNCPTSTECTLLTPAASKPGPVDVTATVGKTTSPPVPADRYAYT